MVLAQGLIEKFATQAQAVVVRMVWNRPPHSQPTTTISLSISFVAVRFSQPLTFFNEEKHLG
jgi:hypothetical protein